MPSPLTSIEVQQRLTKTVAIRRSYLAHLAGAALAAPAGFAFGMAIIRPGHQIDWVFLAVILVIVASIGAGVFATVTGSSLASRRVELFTRPKRSYARPEVRFTSVTLSNVLPLVAMPIVYALIVASYQSVMIRGKIDLSPYIVGIIVTALLVHTSLKERTQRASALTVNTDDLSFSSASSIFKFAPKISSIDWNEVISCLVTTSYSSFGRMKGVDLLLNQRQGDAILVQLYPMKSGEADILRSLLSERFEETEENGDTKKWYQVFFTTF